MTKKKKSRLTKVKKARQKIIENWIKTNPFTFLNRIKKNTKKKPPKVKASP